MSASNNVKISSRLFKEVISEIGLRLPREPTEEFSAGMAILNLLTRSITQMFLTNVELGTSAAHIFIFDQHLTGARQLLPFGRSGLPEVAVVAGLLLLERFPNNHWLRDDKTLCADQGICRVMITRISYVE